VDTVLLGVLSHRSSIVDQKRTREQKLGSRKRNILPRILFMPLESRK